MKKSLSKLISEYCQNSNNTFNEKVYYSESAPDARYKGYKYFFKYHNTHSVAVAFKTQKEIEDYINN